MKTIKFSHRYHKLNNFSGNKAILLAVFNCESSDISKYLREYDTAYYGHKEGVKVGLFYKLPSGPLLVLLFEAHGHLFTTIRSNTKFKYDKEKYYKDAIGEAFHVSVQA